MVVTLIGKDTIYKTKLPTIVSGSYWITGKNDKRLINIEEKNNCWTISSNKNMKIVRNRINNGKYDNFSQMLHDSENFVDKIVLKDYSSFFVIFSKKFNEELFVLYCSPTFEENYKQLFVNTSKDIYIGSDPNNDIIYNNKLVKKRHARIFFDKDILLLENFDTSFGTFVNGRVVTPRRKLLFNGDVIFIMGLKIIILGRSIFINNPLSRVEYNKNIFIESKVIPRKLNLQEDDEEDIELYSDKDYFVRAPRIIKKIQNEKIEIDQPPENQDKNGMPLILTLGSTLGMGIVMLISTFSSISGIRDGSYSKSNIILTIAASVAMILCMVLFPILTSNYEKKKKKEDEKNRQERYKKYINSKIEQIDKIMNRQKSILYENYISAEECVPIALHKDSRLWEHKIDDSDFLTVRVGIGDLPLEADIDYPKIGFRMEDDNLIDILNTVVNKSKMIKDVPITISLTQKNIIGLIVENNERTLEKFVQSILIQLVTLQSYEDLNLIFFLKKDTSKAWEHMQTLPHIWDSTKQIRFWADEYSDMQEISRFLETELKNRMAKNDQGKEYDYRSFKPYYLIITDDYKKIENLKIITEIRKQEINMGFSIFCITDNLLKLPTECKAFIDIKDNSGEMFENEITSEGSKHFTFDTSLTILFEKIGKSLSAIPLKSPDTSLMSLPESYSFLEMYKVGKIEQLNILERWRTNDATISLQAPIGIDSTGMPIVLDIHEKAHGPHGLIAGTTGSGKSEFIITYVLSLALNYHPDDVAFVLIDYKGGGLAGAFKKNEIMLPHLVGTITNIDTVGLQRSLTSIQSELRRRQILFNKARDKTDGGTIDIYKYQKLYHEGIVNEPIPHLLIICDEFAELKQQQEDFMDELISVSRIGRSLGVHLILATQKPAGVVSEQIRSNSKFGICLKVQDAEDSIDIIKRPEAAELTRAGQFYMQVGNNEYFVLGQSAWSGASYIPSDEIKKDVDTSIKFISTIGSIIKSADMIKQREVKVNGDQLTNIVRYLYKIAKQENIKAKSLWLENIPETIFLNNIKQKYNIINTENNINPLIGEYDDPFNQRQGAVELNLSKNGNTIIYGNAESGKETLLSTLIYDIMLTHTAEETQIYILDCGSEVLKIFKESPVVGDVVFANDDEKISRLFEMLQKMIKERTAILSNYGGDYNLYIKSKENVMPMIIVIINNYEAFSENYEDDYDDLLLSLTREGMKYGIIFITTASTFNDLRYRLSQNFAQRIALQLNNDDDYLNIFNDAGKKRPSHLFGRGLIKLEDIYEFQTARICKPEEWNSYINEKIESLKKTSKVFANPIPTLPKEVNLDDVKEEIKNISSVPIGIDKKSLNVFTYDFEKSLINIITGKNVNIVAKFLIQILKIFNNIKDVEVKIFDTENIIQTKNVDLNLDYKNFMLEISNNLKRNKDVICVIIGLDKFINRLEGGEGVFFETLQKAEKLENYHFIIAENYTRIKNFEFSDWYKEYITGDNGIWVGNGISDQFLINIDISNTELNNNCGESFGYAIDREEPNLIKLLGMKGKEE